MKRVEKLLLAVAASALPTVASADVYGPSAPIGPIPDVSFVARSLVAANIANPTIMSVNSVTVNVTTAHTWVGDISLILTAPNGDDCQLMRRPGTSGVGNSGDWLVGAYTFVTSGGLAVPNVGNMAPGTYNRTNNAASTQLTPPVDPDTYSVFDGDDLNGSWTLTARDDAGGDTGALGTWSLDITSIPAPGSLALLGLGGLIASRRRRA